MLTLNDFQIGEQVLFGRSQGEKTQGTIIGKGRTKLKIRQDEARGTMRDYRIGTIWTVPLNLVYKTTGTPVVAAPVAAPEKPKRTEAEIMVDIRGVYCMLSPENLSCDGECSRSETTRRAAALNRRLRELEAELGRRVSESEAYGLPALPKFPTWAPAKQSGFKIGDKIEFNGPRGAVVTGFIKSVNDKTCTINGIDGRGWRVTPGLIRKVA